MPKKTQMTDRIYAYLREVIPRQGYAPSVREICEAVGLKSPSTARHGTARSTSTSSGSRSGGSSRRGTARAGPWFSPAGRRRRIPIVGAVAAGAPILAQECVEDYLTFDCGGREGESFALRVRGESMINAGILPGDLVVVRRQQTAENGEIVVALLEDEATVKRLSRRNGQVWLLPENEAYQPIDGTYAQILGKVVAVVRQYR